jgi:hypothetical protein
LGIGRASVSEQQMSCSRADQRSTKEMADICHPVILSKCHPVSVAAHGRQDGPLTVQGRTGPEDLKDQGSRPLRAHEKKEQQPPPGRSAAAHQGLGNLVGPTGGHRWTQIGRTGALCDRLRRSWEGPGGPKDAIPASRDEMLWGILDRMAFRPISFDPQPLGTHSEGGLDRQGGSISGLESPKV